VVDKARLDGLDRMPLATSVVALAVLDQRTKIVTCPLVLAERAAVGCTVIRFASGAPPSLDNGVLRPDRAARLR
jgi:hypothetical protein